jgi:hypothetical protein
MTLDFVSINWIAVAIATAAYVLLGAVFFAPQLPTGRAWMAASGYESPQSGAMSTNAFYIIPVVTSFFAVVVTALLARATGTDTLTEGLVLGLLVGVGYAATVSVTTAAFEFSKPRQWTWGAIDAAYHVLGLVVAAVILALIR